MASHTQLFSNGQLGPQSEKLFLTFKGFNFTLMLNNERALTWFFHEKCL